MNLFRIGIVCPLLLSVFNTCEFAFADDPASRLPPMNKILKGADWPVKMGDDEVRKVLIEKHNLLLDVVRINWEVSTKFSVGPTEAEGFTSNYLRAIRQFTDARLELAGSQAERVQALQLGFEVLKVYESQIRARAEGGLVRPQLAKFVTTERLDMEMRLLKAKKAARE